MKKKSTIEAIVEAQYTLIIAPFHGAPVPVMARELTQAQQLACGYFSAIETFQDKIEKKQLLESPKNIDLLKIIEYAEKQHEVCKRSLRDYDLIIEAITDSTIEDSYKRIDAALDKLKSTKKGPEREALERELDILRIWTDLILPDDFTATIVSYALSIDKSDIKELGREALLSAAILAKRGRNNPADHMQGNFAPWMLDDINIRAWNIYDQEAEKNKRK
jgi:hypothetical protein